MSQARSKHPDIGKYTNYQFQEKDIVQWATTRGWLTRGVVFDPNPAPGKIKVTFAPGETMDDQIGRRRLVIRKAMIVSVERSTKSVPDENPGN